MQVEVNEVNIDRYQLVALTGSTREEMLNRAAEAAESGYVLSCEVPDDQVIEHNVFDTYQDEYVDSRRLVSCMYETVLSSETNDEYYVCIQHGFVPSVPDNPKTPCLAMVSSIGGPPPCFYGEDGLCVIHQAPSRFDTSRFPNALCNAAGEKA